MNQRNKTKKYSMRITAEMHTRLKLIADELETPMSDMFVTGALMLYARATNPGQFLEAKSKLFAETTDPTQKGNPRP